MGLFETHIHSRLVVYPLMPRADMRVALCLPVVAGNPECSFSELNLLRFRVSLIQRRLSIPEKLMSRYPARLILCFLLKFITYTTHFCTFVCNIVSTRLSLPKSTQLLKTPLSSQENLVIQAVSGTVPDSDKSFNRKIVYKELLLQEQRIGTGKGILCWFSVSFSPSPHLSRARLYLTNYGTEATTLRSRYVA